MPEVHDIVLNLVLIEIYLPIGLYLVDRQVEGGREEGRETETERERQRQRGMIDDRWM